jgi:peptidoglycan/xylan/chitin deacetylase (PgdA/CDA1 family)
MASFPKYFLNRYSSRCGKIIGNKKIFLLSFDCDNFEDIEAIEKISSFLNKLQIKSTFAVPGEILLRGSETFKELSRLGHEFIGHGYKRHSDIQSGKYISTLFYNKISDAELEEDITKGVKAIKEVLGYKPEGFRIPHFGHSNTRTEMGRVYRVLNKFNIKYSSSTIPYYALLKGPIFHNTKYNISELPISPSVSSPFSILDTYNYGFRLKNERTFDEYGIEMTQVFNFFKNKPIVLNYYCDPSQAIQMDSWFKSIKYAAEHGYKFITLKEFYNIYRKI